MQINKMLVYVSLRFGQNKSLKEIGKILKMRTCDMRQYEAKYLRSLRNANANANETVNV